MLRTDLTPRSSEVHDNWKEAWVQWVEIFKNLKKSWRTFWEVVLFESTNSCFSNELLNFKLGDVLKWWHGLWGEGVKDFQMTIQKHYPRIRTKSGDDGREGSSKNVRRSWRNLWTTPFIVVTYFAYLEFCTPLHFKSFLTDFYLVFQCVLLNCISNKLKTYWNQEANLILKALYYIMSRLLMASLT